jgi:hypothetical protein
MLTHRLHPLLQLENSFVFILDQMRLSLQDLIFSCDGFFHLLVLAQQLVELLVQLLEDVLVLHDDVVLFGVYQVCYALVVASAGRGL